MSFIRRLIIIFSTLIKINILKSVYFNFKVLPYKQAVKLPFHFYGKTDLDDISGEFVILNSKLYFGMISFGGKHEIAVKSNKPNRIYNKGKIVFNGSGKFGMGNNVVVLENGILTIGYNFAIGSETKIICFRNISLGNNILVSWECQFFDSDFHFIKLKDNLIKDNCGELIIEDNVWVGSKVTLLKNTYLSKSSIIGSNSVCSGNYKEKHGDSILLAGIPAVFLKKDVSYVVDKSIERKLRNHFKINQNIDLYLN